MVYNSKYWFDHENNDNSEVFIVKMTMISFDEKRFRFLKIKRTSPTSYINACDIAPFTHLHTERVIWIIS